MFHAAYAGLDPMDMTYAKFVGLCNSAPRAMRRINGKDEGGTRDMEEEVRFEILADAYLSSPGQVGGKPS